jgi:hypothetical protein
MGKSEKIIWVLCFFCMNEDFFYFEKFFSAHKRRAEMFCGFFTVVIFIVEFLVKKFFMFFSWVEGKLLDNERKQHTCSMDDFADDLHE